MRFDTVWAKKRRSPIAVACLSNGSFSLGNSRKSRVRQVKLGMSPRVLRKASSKCPLPQATHSQRPPGLMLRSRKARPYLDCGLDGQAGSDGRKGRPGTRRGPYALRKLAVLPLQFIRYMWRWIGACFGPVHRLASRLIHSLRWLLARMCSVFAHRKIKSEIREQSQARLRIGKRHSQRTGEDNRTRWRRRNSTITGCHSTRRYLRNDDLRTKSTLVRCQTISNGGGSADRQRTPDRASLNVPSDGIVD